MKKLRFSKVAIILATALIVGCNNGIIDVKPQTNSATPFASSELLESIADTDGVVNWKVARFFALNDLDNYRADNGWTDAWLSEYPFVIYNAETGNPRYYEFRVLKDGKEVGAISCAADKGEGSPVQYVLPFVHEITNKTARSVETSAVKLVDSGYPGRLLAQQDYGEYSRAVDADTGSEVLNKPDPDAKVLDVLLNASKEELKLLGIENDEVYNSYVAAEKQKAEQLATFWQEVDQLTDKITSMTEEELQEAFNAKSDSARGISTYASNTFTLKDWVEKSTWSSKGTYCGPNVIAFIMLGLGTKSGFANIPIFDDYNQLINYYGAIQNSMKEGAKLFDWFGGDSLNGWLNTFTGGRYRLATLWSISSIVCHDWNLINVCIRGNQLPAISLRFPKIENIGGGFHYRTIIGTREVSTKLEFKVLWWTVSIPLLSEGQYLMHDNGTDGAYNGTWWEGWSLYHFQAASVIKN